jgi:glycosyltransferase involved in cell wall biosynthesis
VPQGLRVVIAHDFMETYGGAERVTADLAAAFPDAEVVAVLGRREVARRMGVADRFRSLMPPEPTLLRHYRMLAPVLPTMLDRVRLPDADVLLSSSYGFAHRLRTANRAPHVCYCHSPLRFAWSMTDSYRDRWARGDLAGRAFDAFAAGMRASDRRAADRVDAFLTQSPFTATQIRRFYGREAEVVGAPVDCDRFRPSSAPPGEHFLLSGRLVEPYKRVSIAIEAFRRLPHRLLIAGDGPALPELRAAAPRNVEFLGHLEDDALVEAMQGCAAALFPSRDDFGLVPVEVMACGRPVLAYAGGGAVHTVVPGVTGELFAAQTADAVVAAVRAFDPSAYDANAIRAHAERWDRGRFLTRVRRSVARTVAVSRAQRRRLTDADRVGVAVS